MPVTKTDTQQHAESFTDAMIGNSWPEWVVIQVSVLFFRFNPLIYLFSLLTLFAHSAYQDQDQQQLSTRGYTATKAALSVLLLAEAIFYITIYRPHLRRAATTKAAYPGPLSKPERQALFQKCLGHASDPERYLRGWFHNAALSDIRRDNLREFFLWAFLDEDLDALSSSSTAVAQQRMAVLLEEVDGYIAALETRLGHLFASGRSHRAKSLRLNLDPVVTAYRGLAWYLVIFCVDMATHAVLRWHGFRFYGRSGDQAEVWSTFPPRPQEWWSRYKSPAPSLGYWYYDGRRRRRQQVPSMQQRQTTPSRPVGNRSTTGEKEAQKQEQLPVVFFHGIGVGLLTYLRFLIDLVRAGDNDDELDGGMQVMAVELLPVSFRLTSPPLDKRAFLDAFTTIVDAHGWGDFAIVSHSYGSVPTTHILTADDAALSNRAKAVTLVDPVTIMLHLPHVAYNFTRRRPRSAAEWQLWYFASTDVGVATVLGRHFFWRQNIIWKEDLLRLQLQLLQKQQRQQSPGRRRITVSLAAKDIIVNAPAVAEYLAETTEDAAADAKAEQSHIDVVWFPKLDHAQVFDTASDYNRIIERILA